MSELQTGLLAIGALVIAGVLVYNRVQERRAKRDAERAFGSGHDDILLQPTGARHGAEPAAEHAGDAQHDASRHAARAVAPDASAQPDPAIDYIIEFAAAESVPESAL